MSKKIYIGVAWPYVNGDIHVGHFAGNLLPPDIYARFHRLIGNDVLMVSGSDCNGSPITIQADKEGIAPSEVVKKYHKKDVDLFNQYNLSYNLYTTTTTSIHEQVVQDLFLDLLKNGFIVKKVAKQYYSEKDDRFLPDRYVEGECPYCNTKEQRSDQCESCGRMLDTGELIEPYSKLTNSQVSLKKTEHYYLDLEELSARLEEYVDSKKDVWRNWIYQEAKGWIKEGLKPRAITRDLDWGVALPEDRIPDDMRLDTFKGKKIYVWFEAVTGYLSAAQEWALRANDNFEESDNENEVIYNKFEGQGTEWKDWYLPENEKDVYSVQFLGQDNVVFHTILWQGQLLGSGNGYKLPNQVAANKFMNYEGKKFSKSRGHMIDSKKIANDYGVDVVRYYIASNFPENKQGNFTWEGFETAINNELVANLGNFVNRTLIFAKRKLDEEVLGESLEQKVEDVINRKIEEYREKINNVRFVDGINIVMEIAAFGNKYFNDSEVWKVIKDDPEEGRQIIFNLLQIVQTLSILIEPYLPETSIRIRQMLGLESLSPKVGNDQIRLKIIKKFKIGEVDLLFEKVEIES